MANVEDETATLRALDELVASLAALEAEASAAPKVQDWPPSGTLADRRILAPAGRQPVGRAAGAAVDTILSRVHSDWVGGAAGARHEDDGESIDATIARLEALNDRLAWEYAVRSRAPAPRTARPHVRLDDGARPDALLAYAPAMAERANGRQTVRGLAAQLAAERAHRRDVAARAADDAERLRARCHALQASNAALRDLLLEHARGTLPLARSCGAIPARSPPVSPPSARCSPTVRLTRAWRARPVGARPLSAASSSAALARRRANASVGERRAWR
ncbi:hypothetical protein KFE25_004181 [Diacronema lutheri]|uniref:Uncharacterized protein n=1 Tax=Diacronema lutheri TaxID=2081491 RepID=A0A8J5X734_DIALT|nr:hypothetical protein KFE25_004181 [Diacronema lutheri]